MAHRPALGRGQTRDVDNDRFADVLPDVRRLFCLHPAGGGTGKEGNADRGPGEASARVRGASNMKFLCHCTYQASMQRKL